MEVYTHPFTGELYYKNRFTYIVRKKHHAWMPSPITDAERLAFAHFIVRHAPIIRRAVLSPDTLSIQIYHPKAPSESSAGYAEVEDTLKLIKADWIRAIRQQKNLLKNPGTYSPNHVD